MSENNITPVAQAVPKIRHAHKDFKTMNFKGKEYVEVKERVKYLANEFPGNYTIQTDYQYFPEQKLWVVKATLTLMQDGIELSYTGLGQEIESKNGVNFTSALENAETSAVGRACAFAGIGVDISIASADEITKANNREQRGGQTPKPEPQKPTPDQQRYALDVIHACDEMRQAQTVEAIKIIWNKHKAYQTEPEFEAAAKKRKTELTSNQAA